MSSNTYLGFLGGGQMATAIAKGVIQAGLANDSQFAFFETNDSQRAKLKLTFPNASILDGPQALWSQAHRIVLAVKPQVLEQIAISLAPLVQPHHLLVSIAAGIPIANLTSWFRTERIIRVMPNTPCQSLQGASGIAAAHGVNAEDKKWCDEVFQSVGRIVHVTDDQLHAVTGVSGSGPAYVLMMIEAMSDGGVMAGLSRENALILAAQTVLGAATMVLETGIHPSILREQVTSPAGTTIAALSVLERNGFRSAIIDAVMAANDRSKELGGAVRKPGV